MNTKYPIVVSFGCNCTQRVCVWLSCVGKKKETEPIGKSARIFRVHTNQAIGYTRCWLQLI